MQGAALSLASPVVLDQLAATATPRRLAGSAASLPFSLQLWIAGYIMRRGSSKQSGYAARDVRHSASLADRAAGEGGIEGHEALVARLKRRHGRKYGFWQLLDTQ